MKNENTFNCQIWKIDSNRERVSDDPTMSGDFGNATEAGEFIYNNHYHPIIDCAGFDLVVNDEILNTYIYGKGWDYPIDAQDKAIETA